MAKKIYEACRRLLTTCANCQPDENILIVTDTDSLEIGMALWDAAEEFPKKTMVMMEPRKMHGEEPTPLVAAAMLKADVIFRATKFSLSHSHARRDACAAGARDLNCCDYSIEMLEKGGLYTDFEADRKYVDQLLKSMANGDQVHITSEAGTDYYASIKGHKLFPQYGMVRNPGETCSPPDIEMASGAMPGTAHGKIVVDGSITHRHRRHRLQDQGIRPQRCLLRHRRLPVRHDDQVRQPRYLCFQHVQRYSLDGHRRRLRHRYRPRPRRYHHAGPARSTALPG